MSVKTWQRQVAPFYGWRLLVALAVLDFINLGFPVTGGAVINTYMLREIPMSRAIYGLGFTLLNLFVALTSISVAAFIVKRGVRTTLVVGSGAIAAGALSLAFLVSKPWQYLVSFGIVVATGVSFGSIVPITTAVSRWFNRYRGRAMAIALSSSSLGGIFVAPAMNKILEVNHGQWRQAWELVAAVAAVSMIVAIVFVKDDPADLGQVVDGLPGDSEGLGQSTSCALPNDYLWNSSEAYSTAAYWMIVVGGIASYFPFFFLMAHWILRMRLSRFSATEAAWALAFFSAAGIAGRLIGGWLIDKIASRYACAVGFSFYLAGSLLALRVEQGELLTVFSASVLFGIGFGWTFISVCTMTAQYYGPSVYPKLNGMMILVAGSIGAPAGLFGGKVFDLYHSYTPAFELIIVLALLGTLTLIAARPPRPPPIKASGGQGSIETGSAELNSDLSDAGERLRKAANHASRN